MSEKNEMRKAIILDRDGVINHDPGDYTRNIRGFQILPGVEETLKRFSNAGFSIVVITNQGGIAKGEYSLDDFYEIDRYMSNWMIDREINFLETFFCPHHDKYTVCLCRKPKRGMVEKAIAKYHIDPEKSFMIGDKQRDLDSASPSGIRGILVPVNADLRNISWPFTT